MAQLSLGIEHIIRLYTEMNVNSNIWISHYALASAIVSVICNAVAQLQITGLGCQSNVDARRVDSIIE